MSTSVNNERKTTSTASILQVIMSTDAGPELPPEIFDAFIDQVDANLLGVCSLVSKLWLPRSRRHLFERVVIIGQDLKPFLDLVDNPLCTIKPHVHIVEMEGAWDANPRWLEDGLLRLSTFPAVYDLAIAGGKFTSLDTAKKLASFQNLQELALSHFEFGSLSQLLESLSLCTSLKNVDLSCLIINDTDLPGTVYSPPPLLRSVGLSNDSPHNDILEWLVSGEHVSIETLKIFSFQEVETRAIAHCLRALGNSLKNLEVGFPIKTHSYITCLGLSLGSIFSETFCLSRILEAFLHDVNLSHNPNINSIHFKRLWIKSSSSRMHKAGIVESLLAQITSFEVREAVMEISLSTLAKLKEVDWGSMAEILQKPNFSKLEKFAILGLRHEIDVGRARHWMIQAYDRKNSS
jgi:hypothetical protein